MSVAAAQWLNSLCQLQLFQPSPVIPLQCSCWPEISTGAFVSLQRSMAAVSATEWTSVLLCTTVLFQHVWNTALQSWRNWDLEDLCSYTDQICTPVFTGFGLLVIVCYYSCFLQQLDKEEINSRHLYEIFYF